MSYNNFSNADEGGMSKFNPAALKMSRINKINEIINFCKTVPLSFNPDYNTWNFILWFENLNCLFKEVFIKFSDAEKKECEARKLAIDNAMQKYPVVEYIRGRWTSPNERRWQIIKKYLEQYENKIKEWQDKHGLDVPEQDESSLF